MDLSMNMDDGVFQDSYSFHPVRMPQDSAQRCNSASAELDYENDYKDIKNNNLLNGRSCSLPVSPSSQPPLNGDLCHYAEGDEKLKEKVTVGVESKMKSGEQQQEFCLRWNNYKNNLTSVFDELLQNESFVDVTLACEGQSIKAHKMVLSACSPYFRRLFYENPCQHPIIIMRDVKWNELNVLLQFMYRGELNISKEEMCSLFRVGHMLKIKGLTEITKGNVDCSDGMQQASHSLHLILPDARQQISTYDEKTHQDIISKATDSGEKTLHGNRKGIEMVKKSSVQLELEIGLEMRQDKQCDNDFAHNFNNETIKRMHRCEYMRKVEKIQRDTTTALINNGRRMVSAVARAPKRSRLDLKIDDDDNNSVDNDNDMDMDMDMDNIDDNDGVNFTHKEVKEKNRDDTLISIIDDIDDRRSVQKLQTNQICNSSSNSSSRFIYPMKALTDRTAILSNNKSAAVGRQDLSESDIKSASRLNGAYAKFSKYSTTWSAVHNGNGNGSGSGSGQEFGCWSPDKTDNNKSCSCDVHPANCSLKCLCRGNDAQRMLLLQTSKRPFPADVIYSHARVSGTVSAASLAAVSSLTSAADYADKIVANVNSTATLLDDKELQLEMELELAKKSRSMNMFPYTMPDDFTIKPETAEIIGEELNKHTTEPIAATSPWPEPALESSLQDSYQYQLQTMWQKCWSNNQQNHLVQELQLRERGPLKSWKPEAMADAILGVLKEGLSLSQAARRHDIPYPTFVLYASRVHNMLGPSLDGSSDNRPKTRGRPQRILLGLWPDELIRSVVKVVVFRDYRTQSHKDRPPHVPFADQLNFLPQFQAPPQPGDKLALFLSEHGLGAEGS